MNQSQYNKQMSQILSRAITKLVPYDVSFPEVAQYHWFEDFRLKDGEYAEVIVFHAKREEEASKFIKALEEMIGIPATKVTKSRSATPKYYVSFDSGLEEA